MIGFDLYNLWAWQRDGVLLHSLRQTENKPVVRRRRGAAAGKFRAVMTAGLFTLGMSQLSLDFGDSAVAGISVISAASAHRSVAPGEVPRGYWTAMQEAMKDLPRLPELSAAPVEIEPYV